MNDSGDATESVTHWDRVIAPFERPILPAKVSTRIGDPHGDLGLFAGLHHASKVGLKRCISDDVITDEFLIHIDLGSLTHGTKKLSAYGLTAADVSQALSRNDYISGLGTTKGQMVQVNLNASTGLHSLEEFRRLVIKQQNGALVRLEDVANVTLGADDYESRVGFDGKKAVYIGIQVAPAANLLNVIKNVRKIFPDVQAQIARRHSRRNRL